MRKNNEFGRTMLEVILYLSVMAVLVTGIIRLTMGVYGKYKLSRIGEQVTLLSKNISARYMSTSKYNTISDDWDQLIEQKVFPGDMVQDDKSLVHAFGGSVSIDGSGAKTFKIEFDMLDKNTCLELALLNWTINDTTNLVSIKINDTRYTWLNSTATQRLPIDLNTAKETCGFDNSNKIIWEFE